MPVFFFDEVLRGSSVGEPMDRKTNGVHVELFEGEGRMHVRMSNPNKSGSEQVALFSLSEARRFADSVKAIIDRVTDLGEI